LRAKPPHSSNFRKDSGGNLCPSIVVEAVFAEVLISTGTFHLDGIVSKT